LRASAAFVVAALALLAEASDPVAAEVGLPARVFVVLLLLVLLLFVLRLLGALLLHQPLHALRLLELLVDELRFLLRSGLRLHVVTSALPDHVLQQLPEEEVTSCA